jgi:alpha-methylacyl-CoA racemase
MAGIGPAPFCGMLLADLGADVLRVDRVSGVGAEAGLTLDPRFELMNRGKRSIALNLKAPRAVSLVLSLCARADALIEGFRPGVMERLGLGPDEVRRRNPRLVYGRVTGFGQDGPLSQAAGHDLNYLALAGVLHGIGRPSEPPPPPLNVVADMGGGGLVLALGLLAGVLEARVSGAGQVIDAAMVEGASALQCMIHGLRYMGLWGEARGENLLDGGAHFYRCYETSDGKYLSVAAIEPQFYAELLRRLGVEVADLDPQLDRERWGEMGDRLQRVFRSKTRDEWCKLLEGTDACVAPVLSMSEAQAHRHNRSREGYVEVAGVAQPSPVPRFSRTTCEVSRPPPVPGEGGRAALSEWGVAAEEVERLISEGVLTAGG